LSRTLHILRYKTLAISSYFKNLNSERAIKGIAGLIVIASFFSGSLYFFYRVFDYLASMTDIGFFLMNKIISLGCLAIFIMLVISNLVTAITTLYRSQETAYLLSTPATYRQVFTVKFIDNIVFSTWAVMVLGLPVMIAYGMVRGFVLWEYIFEVFCILIPFVLIPGCIGVGFAIFMFLASREISPKMLILLITSLLVLAVALYFKLGQPTSLAINVASDWRVLNRYLGSMGATSFAFLPSFWVSETFRLIATGASNTLFIYMLALGTSATLAVNAIFLIADRFYYSSWLASLQYRRSISQKVARRKRRSSFFRLPNRLPSDFRVVLAKDLKLFSREPAQWAQFSMLLVLLVLYLVNLKSFSTNANETYWMTFIGFTNFAFSGFILATLSVRFVFPNISLEGRPFWAIVSSPMRISRVFWVKFWSAFIIFLIISEVLALVSNIILGLRGILMVLSFFSMLLMSVSLVSLSVGMGAIYPRFEERNPGKIASSAGGILTTVLSLVYVGMMVIIAALPVRRYTIHKMDPTIPFPMFEVALSLVLMAILNLITTVIPLRLGYLSMKKRDY
jgi:ABC-2 type transport system permease protein